MALQVRRGTNAERLGITPLAGELIYVTDTKQLYIGDGTTAGGTTSIANTIDSVVADTSPQLGGELDLNGNNITGTGNINITGTISASGNINLGDGVGSDILVIGGAIQGHLVPDTDITWNLGSTSKHFNEAWISQLNVENQLTVGRIMGDLIADDSTVVFDSSTGLVTAGQLTGTLPAGVIPAAMTSNITGDLTGNSAGVHTGAVTGDLTGSVFADDSTLIVDGLGGGSISANRYFATDDIAVKATSAGAFEYKVEGNNNTTALSIITNKTGGNLTGTSYSGKLFFGYDDDSGSAITSAMLGGEDAIYFVTAADGDFSAEASYLTFNESGSLGIGTYTPTATLDVRGAIKPGVYADNAARDAAITSPVAGMMVFNTTGTKFQGYTGSAWVDLN